MNSVQAMPYDTFYNAMDQPPVFTDIGDGLDHLDEIEAEKIRELEEAAREAMQLDEGDPTKQSYFRREDRRTVVKTEQEYALCERKGVCMTVISYAAAVQLLKEEDGRKRQERKLKSKKKAQRKARQKTR